MKKYTAWVLALLFYVSVLPWNMAGATDYWNYNVHKLNFDNTYLSTLQGNDLIVKGPWVDVRAYGAVAGGSASANATALAAAIVYANANNLDIFIPIGVFAYNGDGLTFNTTATTGHGSIHGVGPGSVLDYQGTGVALSMADGDGSGRYAPYLHDFRITTSAGTPLGGLHIGAGAQYGMVNGERIYIDGFDNTNAYGMRASKVVSSHFIDSSFWDNYDGFITMNTVGSWPTTLTFSSSRFRSNDRHGVFLQSGLGITFESNCIFESNQHAGIYATGIGSDPSLGLIKIIGNHFENNGGSTDNTDYNIDIVGTDAADPIPDVWIQSNYIQDTAGGGHIRYGKLRYVVIRDNFFSGTDGPEDVANVGNNRFVEWLRNHGINETSVTAHGNNAEDADQYQASGINLRTQPVGATYWTTHQLKSSSALVSLPGDNATLTTIASLILNGTDADIAGGIVLVSGYNAGLTAYFVDLVALSYGAAAVISTSNTVGSPAARTYSVSSNVNLQVKFANDADTYAVRVSQLTN